MMISDFKITFLAQRKSGKFHLSVKSILTSNWGGERGGRIPKERYMDFRSQAVLAGVAFQAVTSSKAFLFSLPQCTGSQFPD